MALPNKNCYKINEIKKMSHDRIIRDVLKLVKRQISLKGIFIIGAAAESFIERKLNKIRDLDILLLTEKEYKVGEVILDLQSIEKIIRKGYDLKTKLISLCYNGVPLNFDIYSKATFILDLIPDSNKFVDQNDPVSILDVAKRKRILIWGEDYYSSKEMIKISANLVKERIKIALRYIDRELEKRNISDIFYIKYISKAAILFLSLLFIEEDNTLNKRSIVSQGKNKFPDLAKDLQAFLDVYEERYKIEREKLRELFKQFTGKLIEQYIPFVYIS